MYLKYLYICALGLCSIAGVISIQKLTKQLKVIALLCFYTFILEFSVVFFKKEISYEGNVLPQYNFFVFLEFMFYAYFFKKIIKNRHVSKVINCFLLIFPLLWYMFTFYCFNILEWNSYSFVLGGTFVIFFALIYCYELLTRDETTLLLTEAEFWIAIGLIIFYTCEVPYMGMYRYLSVHYMQLAVKLKNLNLVTNIIMYSLFAYAFICSTIRIKRFYL